MTFIEIFGLVVSGAGTLASVLGIFFAVYAKHNGRLTREFIAEQNKEMEKFIAELFTKLDERSGERHRGVLEALKR